MSFPGGPAGASINAEDAENFEDVSYVPLRSKAS